MGFIDHLMELRKRLWISIIAVALCIVIAVIYYKQIYNFLAQPVRDIDVKYIKILKEKDMLPPHGHAINLTATQPLGSMIMVIWLGFWAGWWWRRRSCCTNFGAFVSPGLHDHEKGAVKPVLYLGVIFFLTGAGIAYRWLAPMTLDFFLLAGY